MLYIFSAAAHSAPPPAPAQAGGSLLGSIGATIADGLLIYIYVAFNKQSSCLYVSNFKGFCSLAGLAFGTGSAMARRAVDAVLGPRTIQLETVVSPAPTAPPPVNASLGSDACNMHSKAFQDVSAFCRLIPS